MTETFASLQSAAHSGAFGAGSRATPTPEQIRAGNYAKGATRLHGMKVTIETPMYQSRRGKQDGQPWSVLCMAHYGYLNGTVGADGDALDVFVGPMPESQTAYVVNQVRKDGTFDEHKALLGFHDEESARNAYMNSYEKGWTGLGSLTACTIPQFKQWLASGDLTKPLEASDLSNDEAIQMTDVIARWGVDRAPVGFSVGALMYELRRQDGDGQLLDSATMADIEQYLDTGELLDAMVIEFQQFKKKASQLLLVMQRAGGEVNATAVEVSKPFKNRGTTQVAMLFTMSDGQSVSVFFHNPDSTPNKLMPGDELVSWKWVLNKKDITITVAPEKGQDLNPREVARRIMKLVMKNSAKFLAANADKAERTAKTDELKATIATRTTELADLDKQVAELTAQVAAKKAAAAEAAQAAVADPEPAGDARAAPPGRALPKVPKALALWPSDAKTLTAMLKKLTKGAPETVTALGPFKGLPNDVVLGMKPTGSYVFNTVFSINADGNAWIVSSIRSDDVKTPSDRELRDYCAGLLAQVNALPRTDPLDNKYASYVQLAADTVQSLRPQDVYRVLSAVSAGDRAEFAAYLASRNKKLAGEVETVLGELNEESPVPAAPPAAKPTLMENSQWQEKLQTVLADNLGASFNDAAGVVEAQADKVRELYQAGTSPEMAASQIAEASSPVPEPAPGAQPADTEPGEAQERIDRLLNMLTSARQRLSKMNPGDSFYGNLVRDIASMSQQLWDAGYRGTETEPPTDLPIGAQEPASEPQTAEPAADDDTGTIAPEGRENTVKTAKGMKVATGFKVIEARNLIISHETDGTINPDYPAEIQPRDRARTTSQAWVQKTARNLDPDSLGRTQRADSGAPIVGPDRVVESGNGRAMAIREAYRLGMAGEYREWLIENADYFGVSVARIEAMKAPVLVRVRMTHVNRVEFAVEANQDDKLAMTATEKARSDAKRLDTAMLAKLADGDLNSAANRSFVAAFLQSLGDAEAAQYMTTGGQPTASLLARLQAALFAGAYSDDRLLELTADVAKPEIANIVSALNSAAPDFMRAKELDRVGAEDAGSKVTDSVELSLNQEAVNAIIGATNLLQRAKDSGMSVDEFIRQGDMFGGTDPAVAAMAVFISQNNRSAKRMGTAFKAMAQFVESENARKQTAGLFGDEPASFTDIVGAANRKLEQEYGEGLFAIDQTDMFAAPAQAPAAAQAPIPEPDEDEQVQQLQDAKAYLDSIINGTANLSDPEKVQERLEVIYEKWGEGELQDLFSQAADAYSAYALKLTASMFAH